MGSTAISYMIVSNRRRKLARPKNRLMLMMSFFDVLSSTAYLISKVAMPSDSGISGAIGNSATCMAQGICIWLGLAVSMYYPLDAVVLSLIHPGYFVLWF